MTNEENRGNNIELTREQLEAVSGGYPPEGSYKDVVIGESVWAADDDNIFRWGTVEGKNGGLLYLHFGGGTLYRNGDIIPLREHWCWVGTFYLKAFLY